MIFFRLGCALARHAHDELTAQEAIRALREARDFAIRAEQAAGISEELLSEGAWIHYEIPKQLGYYNYFLSELPGVTPLRRRRYLEDAIRYTRSAMERGRPASDPSDLVKFTLIKAKSNLVYLLAELIREGHANDLERAKAEIANLITEIKTPELWEIAENQIDIIDSLAFGAATIGDWKTTYEEAARNYEKISIAGYPKWPYERAVSIVFTCKRNPVFSNHILSIVKD